VTEASRTTSGAAYYQRVRRTLHDLTPDNDKPTDEEIIEDTTRHFRTTTATRSDPLSVRRDAVRRSRALGHADTFARTLAPYFEEVTSDIDQMNDDELFSSVDASIREHGTNPWIAIVTDDSNHRELLSIAALAESHGVDLSMFLVPSTRVAGDGGDASATAGRCRTVQWLVRELREHDGVRVCEVNPVSGHQRTTRDGCGVHSNETPSFATTTRRTRDRIATRAHRCVVHGGWARDGRVRPRSGRRMALDHPYSRSYLTDRARGSPHAGVACAARSWRSSATGPPVQRCCSPSAGSGVESGGPLGRGRGRRSRVGVADFDPTGCDSYSDRYRGSLIFSSSIRVGDRDWENGSTRMSSPDSDEADRNSAERTEKQVGSFEFESQPEAPESPDQGVDGERSLTVRSDNRSSRSTLIVLKSSKRSLTH